MRYSNRGQVHRCLGMCTENQVLCQKVIAYQELVALKWFINIGCYYSHCYLSLRRGDRKWRGKQSWEYL